MKKLRPSEVSENSKQILKILISDSDGLGGKFPAKPTKSTGLSTWQSTWLDPSRQPCRLGCRQGVLGQFNLVHHFRVWLCFGLISRNFLNLTDLI